ncbi:hypothetical protein Tco_0644437 [Tanacetum coccineum]
MGALHLGCRLISWQCKKQTVVANSTTEAEYVAASSCCGQVLWIQNQLLDYGDSNEKKLIQMIKIHTDKNVADLLTKAFDMKTVNGEVQLQALVDGKKIIITEATVRRDLQLEDDEGIDCLPNATIFEQRTLIGRPKKKDTQVSQPSNPINVANEAVNEEPRITLVDETQGRHDYDMMFDTGVLNDEEVFARQDMAEKEVSTADPVTTAGEVVTTTNVEVSTASLTAATITNIELTLAQTLAELKSARPKTKGMKKKDQISFDEQEAIRLQAEFDEEVRLAREKDEANVALIEE